MTFYPYIMNIIYFIIIYILVSIILFLLRKKIKFKKFLKLWMIVYLVLGLFLFQFNYFGRFVNVDTVDTKKYSPIELKRDLKQLENYIIKKNPLYFSDKDKLKEMFKNAYNQITTKMTELEFYRLINPIVVAVNCGHTNLSISDALIANRKEKAKFFPIEVTLIDNKIYAVENYDNIIKAGDEIISINNKNAESIIKIILDNISQDGIGEAKKRYIASRHFNLKYYDFVDNSGEYVIEFLDDNQKTNTVKLSGLYKSKYNTDAWGLHFQDYTGEFYDYEIFEDYAVLNIKLFSPEKNNKFSKFLNHFFEKLNNEQINNLIIDIRGNYGGDPIMSRTLLSYLMTTEAPYFESKLTLLHKIFNYDKPIIPASNNYTGNSILLTDGSNFSTAGHFASLFKYHKIGKIIGERTSGSQLCIDSSMDAVLKNTGLKIRYSTMVYEVAAPLPENNNGVSVDVETITSIEDVLDGKDQTMNMALEFLKID